MYHLALCALASIPLPAFSLRHGPHQLRDPYAYPKYQVQFLNDLPVSKSDANLAMEVGIKIEDEWLDKRVGRGLEGGDIKLKEERLELLPMNFSPADEESSSYQYLCLMPSSNTTKSQIATLDQLEDVEDELDPVQGWQALSHLKGKCLYSKQGWFTYAYCHDSYIRQFRAAAHPHPHPTQGYIPQEDPNFEGYTLGRAYPVHSGKSRPKVKGDNAGSVAEAVKDKTTAVDTTSKTTPAVSFGLGTSSRYLVQHWTDGTRCDKTGRSRTIEVQVHCSMTSGDMIWMIKELAICQYVMIIHSPHLCGLPGFKSKDVEVGGAGIICRQVIEDDEWSKWEKRAEETSQGGEGEHKVLELPYSTRPGKTQPEFRFGLAAAREGRTEEEKVAQKIEDEFSNTVLSIDSNEDLKAMLRKALGLLSRDKSTEHAEDSDGEVVMIAWNEDDEGEAILLDTDVILKEGNTKKIIELDNEQKKALERNLREHLVRPDLERQEKSNRPDSKGNSEESNSGGGNVPGENSPTKENPDRKDISENRVVDEL
ncbi:uncharacterized protein L203_104562 [Cryptococcus depauperatus CBS 7841]|uniref:Protein OS-9 homolog n=1 Tax=Cryptococcus depauperatus CBS 7841 TaxID=1295531 RepID=A0A1E3ILQ1_9TREE|nr:hypothetical protein L203_02238 [Cryptococcus depauperatus CBS 7841]